MTTTTKKARVAKPTFKALTEAFAQAGFTTANREKQIAALRGKLTTANEAKLGNAYMGGYLAGRLYGKLDQSTMDKALALLMPRGKGDVKRTKDETRAMKAASKRWERVRNALQVKPESKRGGARNGAGRKSKSTVEVAPKVKDAAGAMLHVMNMAKMLSSFCKKNETVVAPALSGAVADFVANLTRIKD